MCGRKKHVERSHRSHKQNVANRMDGLYRMASIVERGATARRAYRSQQKGEG